MKKVFINCPIRLKNEIEEFISYQTQVVAKTWTLNLILYKRKDQSELFFIIAYESIKEMLADYAAKSSTFGEGCIAIELELDNNNFVISSKEINIDKYLALLQSP